jgi:hypothetical protein
VSKESILHKLIDVASGRSNLPPHEADALHEEITPGYTDVPLTAEEQAQLDALQGRKDRLAAEQAAREIPAPAEQPVA